MKRMLAMFFLCAASAAAAQSSNLGVMLGNVAGSPQKRVQVAKELGAGWYRPEPVLLGLAEPKCEDCEAARAAGLRLVLVVRNASAANKTSGPMTDANVFQEKLRGVIERYKPEIIVVENEPEDQKNSFSGTAEEFAVELKMACDVAHSAKVKCTHGGLSSEAMAGIVTDELWKRDPLEAQDFAMATETIRAKQSGTSVAIMGRPPAGQRNERKAIEKAATSYLEKHRAEIDRARSFLVAAAAQDIDFANFHWYELKPEEITTVLDVLGRLEKHPQMTDEAGQREERPFVTGEKIRLLMEANVRPVIWAGMDGKDSVGLVDKNGNIRANGRAFQTAAQKY